MPWHPVSPACPQPTPRLDLCCRSQADKNTPSLNKTACNPPPPPLPAANVALAAFVESIPPKRWPPSTPRCRLVVNPPQNASTHSFIARAPTHIHCRVQPSHRFRTRGLRLSPATLRHDHLRALCLRQRMGCPHAQYGTEVHEGRFMR